MVLTTLVFDRDLLHRQPKAVRIGRGPGPLRFGPLPSRSPLLLPPHGLTERVPYLFYDGRSASPRLAAAMASALVFTSGWALSFLPDPGTLVLFPRIRSPPIAYVFYCFEDARLLLSYYAGLFLLSFSLFSGHSFDLS